MSLLEDHSISCPYCGQMIDITIDDSIPDQSYVEDCQICCRPIVLHVHIDGNENLTVDAHKENE